MELIFFGNFIWKFLFFWLSYYYKSVILFIHTHKAPYHLSKNLALENCSVSEKNGSIYLNEKLTLTLPGQLDWKFFFFV